MEFHISNENINDWNYIWCYKRQSTCVPRMMVCNCFTSVSHVTYTAWMSLYDYHVLIVTSDSPEAEYIITRVTASHCQSTDGVNR